MDDSGLENYRYRRLEPGIEDIRLLEIEDANHSPDETISCRLRHFKISNLDDTVATGVKRKAYETLSYAWGETFTNGSHLTDMIFCGDQVMWVTAHLNQGLKRYRETRRHRLSQQCRFLWVDALCINQRDTAERSRQVHIMDLIYQSARCTVIWLGEFWSLRAEEVIRAMVDRSGEKMRVSIDVSLRAEQQRIWQELFLRPWFSRRWVVQEYGLAYAKVFLIGNQSLYPKLVYSDAGDELGLASMSTILRHAEFGTLSSAEEGSKFHASLKDVTNVSNAITAPSELLAPATVATGTLLDRLYQFRHQKCSDPQDTIYALHSISRDRHAITVDYSRSTIDLNLEIAMLYLHNSATAVEVLLSALLTRRHSAYPSWLPDWTQPFNNDNASVRETLRQYRQNIRDWPIPNKPISATVSDLGKSLTVSTSLVTSADLWNSGHYELALALQNNHRLIPAIDGNPAEPDMPLLLPDDDLAADVSEMLLSSSTGRAALDEQDWMCYSYQTEKSGSITGALFCKGDEHVAITFWQSWPANISSRRMLCSLGDSDAKFVVSKCSSDASDTKYTLVNAFDLFDFENDDYGTLLCEGLAQNVTLV